MSRRSCCWLALLVFTTIGVRSLDVMRPLVGQFATKNVTYAMIARNWIRGEASFTRPTVDLLQAGQKGWHLLELPLSAYLAGYGWHLCGGSLDAWGRGVAIACSAVSVGLMFALVRRWHDEESAWMASLVLALSPVSIIYGQMFMLEASVVTLTLLSLWSFDQYLVSQRRWALPLGLASSLALVATKVYLIVIVGVVVVHALRTMRLGSSRRRALQVIGGLILAMLPVAMWIAEVFAVAADPQLAPRIYFSLADSTRTHADAHALLFSLPFYGRLFVDLVGRTLTPLGAVLALASFAHPAWRRHAPWVVVSVLLWLAMPRKFFELNYYHLVTLPVGCVLVGLGWQAVRLRYPIACWQRIAAGVFTVAWVCRFAYGPAYSIPDEDRHVVAAGTLARALVPANAPLATLHGSSHDLLYYCDRPGWALNAADPLGPQLDRVRSLGARYLAIVPRPTAALDPETSAALESFPLLAAHKGYRIYHLPGSNDSSSR